MILSLGLMLVGQRLLNPHPRQQDELPVRRGSCWRVRVLALERVVPRRDGQPVALRVESQPVAAPAYLRLHVFPLRKRLPRRTSPPSLRNWSSLGRTEGKSPFPAGEALCPNPTQRASWGPTISDATPEMVMRALSANPARPPERPSFERRERAPLERRRAFSLSRKAYISRLKTRLPKKRSTNPPRNRRIRMKIGMRRGLNQGI